MSTTVKRILTFIIGVPAVLIFVFFNLYNHLPLNLLIIFFSILGTIEFHNMVSSKIQMFPKWLIVIFTALIQIINYIFSLTSISQDASVFIFVIEDNRSKKGILFTPHLTKNT